MPAPADKPALAPHARLLLDRLPFPRKTAVVDVGANPIHAAPYTPLLKAGGCTVTGFEPQEQAFASLEKSKGPDETYFPFAVGDGKTHDLHLFRMGGFTSIFPPYLPTFDAIKRPRWSKVDRIVPMETVTLDQIPDLGPCDLLKIDIRGGEKLVFDYATRVMAETVAVIVEVRYLQLYHGEPMIGGVDEALRAKGFMLHKFLFNKAMALPNSQAARLNGRRVADQLIDGDAVYIRHPGHVGDWSEAQLMHTALLAATVFDSHSLALWALDELVRRGACPADLPAAYVDAMPFRHLSDAEQALRKEEAAPPAPPPEAPAGTTKTTAAGKAQKSTAPKSATPKSTSSSRAGKAAR